MKRLSLILLVLFALALSTAVVFADPPEIDITDEFLDFDGALVTECGEFNILADSYTTIRTTSFFDKDGNLARENIHYYGTDVLYRDDNPDNGISGEFADNLKVWYDEDGNVVKGHYAGTPWNLHIPGIGTVYQLSGPAFFEDDISNFVKEAGRFVIDSEALCTYFAS